MSRSAKRPSCVLFSVLALLGASEGIAVAAGDDLAFFEAKIRPVLVERCQKCHSSQVPKPKGGLRVDSRSALRAGGLSGPAIVPGNLDASLLYQAITAADGIEPMPPKGKLTAAEIADFRRWISIGAPDLREVPASGSVVRAPTAAANSHDWWSLKPVERSAVPNTGAAPAGWPRNPIDAFVLDKLTEKGLTAAPEADRTILIRRLSFDLLGLPPTREDVAHFVGDQSPEAYERLVDRLLASPHFGERWARYWMDLVHFAETHGHDQDRIRLNAWPYRDYLIRSIQSRHALCSLCPGASCGGRHLSRRAVACGRPGHACRGALG